MTFGAITISYPDGHQEIVDLVKTTLDIGSAPDNDIVIRDDQVAPRQAQLLCSDHVCELLDLGSPNGTYLLGRRLATALPEPLPDGAAIRMGRVTLVFGSPPVDLPAAAAPPPPEQTPHPLSAAPRYTPPGVPPMISGKTTLVDTPRSHPAAGRGAPSRTPVTGEPPQAAPSTPRYIPPAVPPATSDKTTIIETPGDDRRPAISGPAPRAPVWSDQATVVPPPSGASTPAPRTPLWSDPPPFAQPPARSSDKTMPLDALGLPGPSSPAPQYSGPAGAVSPPPPPVVPAAGAAPVTPPPRRRRWAEGGGPPAVPRLVVPGGGWSLRRPLLIVAGLLVLLLLGGSAWFLAERGSSVNEGGATALADGGGDTTASTTGGDTTVLPEPTAEPPRRVEPTRTATQARRRYVVTAPDGLNVRPEPGARGDNPPFANLPLNTEVEVIGDRVTVEDRGIWVQVRVGDRLGWVNSRFLREE